MAGMPLVARARRLGRRRRARAPALARHSAADGTADLGGDTCAELPAVPWVRTRGTRIRIPLLLPAVLGTSSADASNSVVGTLKMILGSPVKKVLRVWELG